MEYTYHIHERALAPTAEQALAAMSAAATANALAGARIRSFHLFPPSSRPGWTSTVAMHRPGGPDDWGSLTRPTFHARRYAPRLLFRNPLGPADTNGGILGYRMGLGRRPNAAARWCDTELQERASGLVIALATPTPLKALLRSADLGVFTGRLDLDRYCCPELFEPLDWMTFCADPAKDPIQNLLAGGSAAMSWLDLRMIPAGVDDPLSPEIEGAKSILRDIAIIGSLLPGRPDLAKLQQYRDRAAASHDRLTAAQGTCDHDRRILADRPPGDSAWFDVLLGACNPKWKAQRAMRFLYSGILAFFEAVVCSRALEEAADTLLIESAAPALRQTAGVWRGFRHARFAWAST